MLGSENFFFKPNLSTFRPYNATLKYINKKLFKIGGVYMDDSKNSAYAIYRALGGIINEEDCKSALERAAKASPDTFKAAKEQAIVIAKIAGIELDGRSADKRVILYGILRNDVADNAETTHHHSQMGDQRLFAEALRMLGDAGSLKKLIAAFPNIDL